MKNRRKRLTALGLALALTVSCVLAGCGKSGGSSSGSSSTETVVLDGQEQNTEQEAPSSGIGALGSGQDAENANPEYAEYYQKMGVELNLPAGYVYQASSAKNEYTFINKEAEAYVSVTCGQFFTFDGHRIFVYDLADFADLASTGANWWTGGFGAPEEMTYSALQPVTVDGRQGYTSHGEWESTTIDMYFFDADDTYGITIIYTGYGEISTRADELKKIVETAHFTGTPAALTEQEIDYYGGSGFHLVCNNPDVAVSTGDGSMELSLMDEETGKGVELLIDLLPGSASLTPPEVVERLMGDVSQEAGVEASDFTVQDNGRVCFVEQTFKFDSDTTELDVGGTVRILLTKNESWWPNRGGNTSDYMAIYTLWTDDSEDLAQALLEYAICSYTPDQGQGQSASASTQASDDLEGTLRSLLETAGVKDDLLSNAVQFTSAKSYISLLYSGENVSRVEEDPSTGLPTFYYGSKRSHVAIERSSSPNYEQYMDELVANIEGKAENYKNVGRATFDISIDGETVCDQQMVYTNDDGEDVLEFYFVKNLPGEFGGVIISRATIYLDELDDVSDMVTDDLILTSATLVMDVGYYTDIVDR